MERLELQTSSRYRWRWLCRQPAGVPQLLVRAQSHCVRHDIFRRRFLADRHPNLRSSGGHPRHRQLRKALKGIDASSHLACISNDASFELDEKLSTAINLDAFEPMVVAAKKAGVKRFIYASSSSVYGVSDAPDVTEDHPLVPLTLYNKYKGMCEPLLSSTSRRTSPASPFGPRRYAGTRRASASTCPSTS